MKLNPLIAPQEISHENLIASFGTGRLVRKPNGDFTFIGGTAADHTAAKEWVSLFLHEASISFASEAVPQPSCVPAGRFLSNHILISRPAQT